LATAAYHDGPERVAYWHELGREQAERLGVTQVVVPVGTREEANDPAMAQLIEGAGLIYLSGGDPHYLAATLRDSLVGDAIYAQWHAGAALAGCSAGAMAMTSWIPALRMHRGEHSDGLGWLDHLRVIPHYDRFARFVPDVLERYLAGPDGATLLGIDEDTAIVGGPHEWRVWGRQSVWRITRDEHVEYAAGSSLTA
jgi:cyanophycinase